MSIFTIHEAKTNLSRLIAKVCAGEDIVIARGDVPVARLVALRVGKERQAGAFKGRLVVGPEFFEPLSEDELSAWG